MPAVRSGARLLQEVRSVPNLFERACARGKDPWRHEGELVGLMSVNDPIADFLTRIRNAGMAKHEVVIMPHSKMKAEIARIMKEQGYINDYSDRGEGAEKELVVMLKYDPDGRRAISGLRRMSRPGRRVYRKQANIPRVLDGLGVAILSTSRGILTDHEARRAGVGGEVLCFVY